MRVLNRCTFSRWDEFSNHSPVTVSKKSQAYRGSLEGVHDSVHDIIVSGMSILRWTRSNRLKLLGWIGSHGEYTAEKSVKVIIDERIPGLP